MLSEGYDNEWISVSLFVMTVKSVASLAQIHGRALRKNSHLTKFAVQGSKSILMVPNLPGMINTVDGYVRGDDESTTNLLAEPPEITFKAHHVAIRKQICVEAAESLKQNFTEYHDLYEKQREDWEPVPAVYLAGHVFKQHIENGGTVNFCIVDFGCGRDGLFEEELAEKVGLRDASNGCGTVTVWALDVIAFANAASLTASGSQPTDGIGDKFTNFVCNEVVCDYGGANAAMIKDTKVDCPVFCLALMACDALCKGLTAAANIVKYKGVIYMQNDVWWYGINPRFPNDIKEQRLKQWVTWFTDYCNSKDLGFQIVSARLVQAKGCMSALVTLTNVSSEEEERTSVANLEGIDLAWKQRLKNIRDSEEQKTPKKRMSEEPLSRSTSKAKVSDRGFPQSQSPSQSGDSTYSIDFS
eukprot:m.68960 g.68960  ORF g.68960 m.68960 type:complete len:414 (+) comp24024_c0_seq1:724-1965(+)